MTKKNLSIAPRKPVSEDAARRLEEQLERKSDGVAGATAPELELLPPAAPPQFGSLRTSPSAKGKKPAPPPKTGPGTRANPRVRKGDGVKTRSTSIALPVDLALELTVYCARNGMRQSEAVTHAVREWLERNG